jgi:hypothetical protein
MRWLIESADSRFEFISINSALLVRSLDGAQNHSLPSVFVKLVGRLGGAKADLRSHLNVALHTISHGWMNEKLSWTLRQALVGSLLENLAKERPPPHFRIILRAFAELGTAMQRNGDVQYAQAFFRYLDDWLRGHFINLKDYV